MPILTINTNVPATSVTSDFIKTTSELVAKLTGKPESYVMVLVNPGQIGCFAGSNDPFISAELQSIGGFSSSNNVASEITTLLTKYLGVAGNRIYLKLTAPNAKDIAHNGKTFG